MGKKNRSASEGNAVTTGIVGENESFDKDPKTLESRVGNNTKTLATLKKEPLKEETTHPAWIISRLPQSCPISYCGETIVVPARCRKGDCFVKNSRMLGKLPKGVQIVPAPEKMPKKR